MKKLIDLLSALMESARLLGIEDSYLEIAKEFIQHHEFELCFDTIVSQMYEFDIER
jgi:hypothetical protein